MERASYSIFVRPWQHVHHVAGNLSPIVSRHICVVVKVFNHLHKLVVQVLLWAAARRVLLKCIIPCIRNQLLLPLATKSPNLIVSFCFFFLCSFVKD